jgi:hypothetical protein
VLLDTSRTTGVASVRTPTTLKLHECRVSTTFEETKEEERVKRQKAEDRQVKRVQKERVAALDSFSVPVDT